MTAPRGDGLGIEPGSDGTRSDGTGRLKVAVLQATGLVNSPQQNLHGLAGHAQEAHQQGADLLVTPELFTAGYAPSLVHSTDGAPQRKRLAEIASSLGMALVASTVEHHEGRRYISASFFDRDGTELTRYRKQHLFGPAENQAFDAGQEPPAVVPFGGINVALGICFDIEFPEFARAAAVAGAELLCIPTAVPLRSGDPSREEDGAGGDGDGGVADPFDTRLIPSMVVPTRALENQLFIAYANHSGPNFAGLSTIADPFGRRLAAAADDSQLIQAEVELVTLREARRSTDYLAHLSIGTPAARPHAAAHSSKGPQ
ncbi:nitrilase-related carbon-nitrogen hydrolase [Pseudarthrobacter sp. S9]|uniref:nitrilase-related carbon-nitrogen hydrolase n=1 Tax=Pseudarthrobacter sp. S9 TaxID=3418421 RepID=UPI003CFF581E